VPLRGDAKAINVNWFMIEILSHAGEVTYHNSFITDSYIRNCGMVAAD
jgi:hypothetical protein